MRQLLLRLTPRALLLVVMEHALVLVAVVAAAALRLGYSDGLFDLGLLWRGVLIATVLQISLHYGDLYDLRTDERGDHWLVMPPSGEVYDLARSPDGSWRIERVSAPSRYA